MPELALVGSHAVAVGNVIRHEVINGTWRDAIDVFDPFPQQIATEVRHVADQAPSGRPLVALIVEPLREQLNLRAKRPKPQFIQRSAAAEVIFQHDVFLL